MPATAPRCRKPAAPQAYATITNLASLILDHQAKGTIAAAWLNKDNPDTDIRMAGYTLHVSCGMGRRSMPRSPSATHRRSEEARRRARHMGYAIFMPPPDEFVMAATTCWSPSPPTRVFRSRGLAEQSGGRFENGKWSSSAICRRRLHAPPRPRPGRPHGPIRLRRAAILQPPSPSPSAASSA